MKCKFGIFILLTGCLLAFETAVSAQLVTKAKNKCLLSKSSLPILGNLTLGENLSVIRRYFPNLEKSDKAPFKNTYAYTVINPRNDISVLVLLVSADDRLAGYSVYYKADSWSSISDATLSLLESLNLTIPQTMWDIWKEERSETVTIECRDFAFFLRLRSDDRQNDKVFSFMVVDASVSKSIPFTKQITTARQNIPTLVPNKSEKFIFPQSGGEFFVEFPQKPTIRKVLTEIGEADEATVITNKDGVLRAEHIFLTTEQVSLLNNSSDDRLRETWLAMGKVFGYFGTTISVGRNRMGRFIKLRGYKIVEGESILVEHLCYYGTYSALIVVTGTKSSLYPTSGISDFISSVKRK